MIVREIHFPFSGYTVYWSSRYTDIPVETLSKKTLSTSCKEDMIPRLVLLVGQAAVNAALAAAKLSAFINAHLIGDHQNIFFRAYTDAALKENSGAQDEQVQRLIQILATNDSKIMNNLYKNLMISLPLLPDLCLNPSSNPKSNLEAR